MDTLGLVGLGAAVLTAAAAIAVVVPTRRSVKPAEVRVALDRFAADQRRLRERQTALGREALASTSPAFRQSDIPVLTDHQWIFEEPHDLRDIQIDLWSDKYAKAEADWRVLRGLTLTGPVSYSEAIQLANPKSPYFNGTIYRLTKVAPAPNDTIALAFQPGHYFDYLDSGEVLAYEAEQQGFRGKLRKRVRDPFDMLNRVASLGILTLTVIKSDDGARFLMHRRSGVFVVGDALYHVVPAGEFTPSDISIAAVRNDFDLWRNIMREYAEELLGMPDAQGQGGRPIDYESASPYRCLNAARNAGGVKVWALGIALDPLTFKPELLTVAVFRSDAFDAIFSDAVQNTSEGSLISDIPFDEEHVEDYITSEHVRLGAQACLKLAWTHRDSLGLST